LKNIIILHKKEGETPLEALKSFQNKNPKYTGSMTYAGRLDPMASGVLVILAGEEIKNKDKYLDLEKEYDFSVLFGFSTDTYDILGKIISHKNINISKKDLEEKIKNTINKFIGSTTQDYPMYSSKTVNGKPLFSYAREKKKVEIPRRKIFIKKLKLEKVKEINNKKLLENIQKRIKKVKGDFRQKEILKKWIKELSSTNRNSFLIADFKIKCSSGTYVRGLAHTMGEKIKIPALAFSIKRTRVGKFK
jgi:tRNA pseudouridine(55) synthase